MEYSSIPEDVKLIMCFRYALGRKTYISPWVADEIIHSWDIFEDWQREQIQRDIRHAIAHNIAGDDCDVSSWEKVLRLEIR